MSLLRAFNSSLSSFTGRLDTSTSKSPPSSLSSLSDRGGESYVKCVSFRRIFVGSSRRGLTWFGPDQSPTPPRRLRLLFRLRLRSRRPRDRERRRSRPLDRERLRDRLFF